METPRRSEEFTRVAYGEPHFDRRAEILRQHPDVRSFFGHDLRTAYVTIAVVCAQLGLAGLVQFGADRGLFFGSWWFIAVFSFVVGAVLTHWLAMSIHECSHNLAAKTRNANRAVSLFANVPMLIPCAMSFHRYHIDHHTFLGIDTNDTDLAQPFEFKLVGNSPTRKFFTLLFFPFLYLFRAMFFAKKPSRLEVLNAALQILATTALWIFVGKFAVLYLFLSFWFGHGIHPVAAHFVHEHYVFSPDQETYSYYGPLNAVTFNVGYHNEHHDFMGVPGWRLPELRARLAPYYDKLVSHDSWTAILVRYVRDKGIAPYTRIVRSKAELDEQRRLSRARAENPALAQQKLAPSARMAVHVTLARPSL